MRYLGALAMYFEASKMNNDSTTVNIACYYLCGSHLLISSPETKRGITDARASLHAALDKFKANGLQDSTVSYVSGASSSDMSNVTVFGVLSSVTGLTAHVEAIQLRGGRTPRPSNHVGGMWRHGTTECTGRFPGHNK